MLSSAIVDLRETMNRDIAPDTAAFAHTPAGHFQNITY